MTTGTQLVTHTDFEAVPTRDYDGAAEFYGDVLGLPFSKRWGEMPAGDAFFADPDGNAPMLHHRYAP